MHPWLHTGKTNVITADVPTMLRRPANPIHAEDVRQTEVIMNDSISYDGFPWSLRRPADWVHARVNQIQGWWISLIQDRWISLVIRMTQLTLFDRSCRHVIRQSVYILRRLQLIHVSPMANQISGRQCALFFSNQIWSCSIMWWLSRGTTCFHRWYNLGRINCMHCVLGV